MKRLIVLQLLQMLTVLLGAPLLGGVIAGALPGARGAGSERRAAPGARAAHALRGAEDIGS